jgi:SAM-dependent methyltransferase/uncharacterized protein YbaR (Trm112 family)
MRIGPNDLVLDIGSGHSPHPRADVLCDRYIDDDTERGGSIRADRPLIVADAHDLPFKDKAFDYVVTSHIIEHMDDPVRFCQELMRVSRAGHIASPSEIAEKLFYWPFHKWYVNKIGDTLVLHPKNDDPNIFGELFDYLYEYNPWYARFQRSLPDLFWIEYEWEGEIKITIRQESPLDLDSPRRLRRMVKPRESLPTMLYRTAASIGEMVAPPEAIQALRALRRVKRSPARPIDLESILACPRCRSAVRIGGQEVRCTNPDCGKVYPIERGFPHLLLDQALRERPPAPPLPRKR